jgi:hypothetical protein
MYKTNIKFINIEEHNDSKFNYKTQSKQLNGVEFST